MYASSAAAPGLEHSRGCRLAGFKDRFVLNNMISKALLPFRKLVHGGVRYLQQGNVKLVMDASA